MPTLEDPQIKTSTSSEVEETTLFQNGRSQAVRIPAKFRMKGDKVYVRQDSITGDLIVSQRRNDWAALLDRIAKDPLPDDFMSDRDQGVEAERESF